MLVVMGVFFGSAGFVAGAVDALGAGFVSVGSDAFYFFPGFFVGGAFCHPLLEEEHGEPPCPDCGEGGGVLYA